MGTLITLVVAVPILAVVARLTWPRSARPPLPLYAGTIVGAFFVGIVAGSLAEGRGLERTLQVAAMLSAAIALVALVSWFRVKPPPPQREPEPEAARRREERPHR